MVNFQEFRKWGIGDFGDLENLGDDPGFHKEEEGDISGDGKFSGIPEMGNWGFWRFGEFRR